MDIKNITFEDCDGVLKVRNHPAIRKFSKNKEVILEETHMKWCRDKLKKLEKDIFLVLKDGDTVAGYIRLDKEEDNLYKVSIAILPKYQGRGLGIKLFKEAIKKLKKGDGVIAEILDNNVVSRKFFEKLGFKKVNEGIYLYKIR